VSFSFYETRNFDPTAIDSSSIVGSAISSPERDSLAVRGATKDLSFSLRGPYSPDRVKLELPLPSNENAFYILKTEFDPAPGQLLVGSGGGAPLYRDDHPSELTTASHVAYHPTCFDGVQNLDETGVDCGSERCPPCGNGEECMRASDCISRLCWSPEGNLPGICTSQCSDGLDNDGDGFADSCDFNCVEHPDFGTDTTVHAIPLEHVKAIGLFGTMHYCTINEGAYLASFAEWSSIASLVLNNIVPDEAPANYDPAVRPPPFVVTMRGCLVADNEDVSERCDSSSPTAGPTPCPDDLSDYPFWSISTQNWSANSGGTNTGAWDYVDYLIEGGYASDTSPINIATVITDREGITPNQEVVNGLTVSLGEDDSSLTGASTVNGSSGRTGLTLAHEVGHAVGLQHDTAFYPGTTTRGIMAPLGAGIAPTIEWDLLLAPGERQGTRWQFTAPSKQVPRTPGFSFTGCSNDSECQTGHPGLVCSPVTATCLQTQ
jgi:hypothetical protein